jgi:hypothetical protein
VQRFFKGKLNASAPAMHAVITLLGRRRGYLP